MSLFWLPEFWFGAVVLCMHQASRYSELKSDDPLFSNYNVAIPNLKVSDYSGILAFRFSVFAFVAVTFCVYFVLCSMSPEIIRGWTQLTGQPTDVENIRSYPLYIAVTMMGASQIRVAHLEELGDLHRRIFYTIIGVPQRVISTSGLFLNQVLARAGGGKAGLVGEVETLLGDNWINGLEKFADGTFYRAQIRRLSLNDENQLDELKEGSNREIKSAIEHLILAATLATVREAGSKNISKLADHLRVEADKPRPVWRLLILGIFMIVIGMTIVWLLVPVLYSILSIYSGKENLQFWPVDLLQSGQYILSQGCPIFIAAAIGVVYVSLGERKIRAGRALDNAAGGLRNHVKIMLLIVLMILIFDIIQALYDFGYYNVRSTSSVSQFFVNFIPLYLLHSFIGVYLAFCVIRYLDGSLIFAKINIAINIIVLTIISVRYAYSRLYYQFKEMMAIDFVVLVVAINIYSSALVLFSVSAAFKASPE